MVLGKASHNSKLAGQASKNSIKKRLHLLEYLPEFFTWLNEQIKLGNRQFILETSRNISGKPKNHPQKKLMFLLVELLEQYADYSGVSVFTINEALKQAFSISCRYTIIKDNKIIEVAPCLYPLHYNSCYKALEALPKN